MANISLHKQFINGLKDLDPPLTEEEIKRDFDYCGGYCRRCLNEPHHSAYPCKNRRHINYFHMCFPNKPFPEFQDHCICKQQLTIINCYLKNDADRILVIGQCCVDMFLPECKGRRCEICKVVHQNRKNNLCADCRKLCVDCKVRQKWKESDLCTSCFNAKHQQKTVYIPKLKLYPCRACKRDTNSPCFCEDCNDKFFLCRGCSNVPLPVENKEKKWFYCKSCNLSAKRCSCGKIIRGSYEKCYGCFSSSKKDG